MLLSCSLVTSEVKGVKHVRIFQHACEVEVTGWLLTFQSLLPPSPSPLTITSQSTLSPEYLNFDLTVRERGVILMHAPSTSCLQLASKIVGTCSCLGGDASRLLKPHR